MHKFTRKRALLAKLETTAGTEAVPTGADNAMLVANLSPTPFQANAVTRAIDRPYFGADQTLYTNKAMTLTFDVSIGGSGTAGTAPAWSPLLQACGFAETITPDTNVVYNPITDDPKTVTIYYYQDGTLHKAIGARGSVDFQYNPDNGFPVLAFTFLAAFVTPVAQNNPVADFSAFRDPPPISNANTPTVDLHGHSGCLHSFNLNMSTANITRDLPGCIGTEKTGRNPSGAIQIDDPGVATTNFFDIASNSTLGAFQLVHGTVAGNISTLDAPKVQVTDPNYGDANGIQTLNMSLVAQPDAGNDEVILTLT